MGLLKEFRKRPCMYMGKRSVSLLGVFLTGIQVVENMYVDDASDRIFKLFRTLGKNKSGGNTWIHFETWLAEKYGKDDTKSFALALEKANNNEENAFDLWFKWYDEFQEATEDADDPL